MTSITRFAGLLGCVLAMGTGAATAAPLTLSYSNTFNTLTESVFGTTTDYAFSTTFTVESTATLVDTLLSGDALGSVFYGYGADAISGFSATFGDHTFTDLLTSVLAPGHAAAIYFDAPLSSGTATNFFVRALDGSGSLSLGSLNCDEGVCSYTTYGLAQQTGGGVSAAYDNTAVLTVGVAAPVPEPETWALMLGGLGLVGMVARRRSRRTAGALTAA